MCKTAKGEALLSRRQGRPSSHQEALVLHTTLAASLPYTLSWVILCLIISLQPSVSPALLCILHLGSVIRNIEFWALQEEIMIRWALEWDPESYISTTSVFGSKPGLGTTVLGDHHDHRVTDFSGDIIWYCWPIWQHTSTLVLRLELASLKAGFSPVPLFLLFLDLALWRCYLCWHFGLKRKECLRRMSSVGFSLETKFPCPLG